VALTRYDLPMQRSVTTRFGTRPVARFATVPPRAREPRLGLDRHLRFRAVAGQPTLLRRPELGPVALLRSEWRAAAPVPEHRPTSGLSGPYAPVRWAKLGARSTGRRPRAATAPWRG
jgi:hypothetical protein